MTTQVIFKIDPKLKKKAQQKAARDGIALSDFLRAITKAYLANDLEFVTYLKQKNPNYKLFVERI